MPLESDIFGLLVSVGDQQALFVDCDEDVLRCRNPMIMPPSGGLDLNSRDNMTIDEVITEEENTEPEGYPPLKERVLSLDNMDWWATLCYVTDTLSYSDNCDDEHAPPINFVIQRPGYKTFGNFSLIWHGDGAARGYRRSFPKKIYLRDIVTDTPVEVECLLQEDWHGPGHANQTYTCLNHTLEFDGKSIIIGASDKIAEISANFRELPPPNVEVVAIEVTQGVQDWNNRLTLVNNRKTAVRVFLQIDTRFKNVSGKLSGKKNGNSLEGSPIDSKNTITALTKVSERRGDIDSSLNFILPIEWTQLSESEELVLELEIVGDPNVCKDKFGSIEKVKESCSKTVKFVTLVPPQIYMIPIPSPEDLDKLKVEVIEKETDGKKVNKAIITLSQLAKLSKPSNEQLKEQFFRIQSIIPIPVTEFETLGNRKLKEIVEILKPLYDANALLDDNDGRKKSFTHLVHSVLSMYSNKDKPNIIYAGVILGYNKNEAVQGSGGPDQGDPAVWFTDRKITYEKDGQIEEGLEEKTSKYALGSPRNRGSHEIGHALGEKHPIKSENSEVCSGARSGAKEIYPHIYYSNTWKKAVAILGPISAARGVDKDIESVDKSEEVWGFDVRLYEEYVDDGEFRLKNLIITNPYGRVYSFMSYCDNTGMTQGRWMDKYHHERIIGTLSSPSSIFKPLVISDGDTAERVSSLLFSGEILLSSGGEVLDVELYPLFSRNRFGRAPNRTGDYSLEFRDGTGGVLLSVPFQAGELHAPSTSSDNLPSEQSSQEIRPSIRRLYFSFKVESPPGYDELAIMLHGAEIAVFEASANAPSVDITNGPTEGQSFGGASEFSVSWDSIDLDGDDLLFDVYYSVDGGLNYEPFYLNYDQSSMSVDTSELAGSQRARFGISVSDGLLSSFAETPVFSIARHRPQATIQTPASGTVFEKPRTIVFRADGFDLEDNRSLEYIWQSNLDGTLGTGSRLAVSSDRLSAGEHTITLTATDSDNMTATASVDIVVREQIILPQPVDDHAFAIIDQTILIDVLINDIDTTSVLNQATLSVSSSPSLGTARVLTLPQGYPLVEYTAASQGQDTLAYSVCDINYDCYTAQIAITTELPGCTILGTDGDDILTGTSGDDIICGLGGNDTIDAKGGNDIIHAGPGDDTIYARVGDDFIYGGDGNDFILAHRGNDLIHGGRGNDTIYAGGGDDAATGGPGADQIYGEADNDNLFGNDGPDTIHGGRGDDTIYAGDGNDTIRGNDGSDTIYPGAGQDTILGTTTQDTIKFE